MDVVIRKSEHLEGEVWAPPSKAYTQRMLIAALLSNGTSRISNPLVSDDTKATLRAVKAFGAKAKVQKNRWAISRVDQFRAPKNVIDCGDSGATLRFMIPVAALAKASSTFTFGSSLKRRPIVPLLQSLKHLGTESSMQLKEGHPSIRIHGRGLKGGKTSIRGDISSQFISGLLFACPRAKEDTEVDITTPLESRNYVQMTIEILNKHDIEVSSDDFTQLRIPANQTYKPCDHEVPGDFSSAAFLLAAAAITSSRLKVKNLDHSSIQGDRAILDILGKMGSKVRANDGYIRIRGGHQLEATDIDAKDVPDLVPVCAVLACYSKGTSNIFNAKRLRFKESDRLASLYLELEKMGAEITMKEDGLVIKGPCKMHGATIYPHNDHRIAMACAVVALGARGETMIQNSECVNKSYPDFFDDLSSLGANIVGR